MGRYARGIVAAALDDPRIAVTLLSTRRTDEAAIRAAFAGRIVAIAAARTARSRRLYDVVWYPFNGMRFGCAAPAVVTIHDAFAFTEAHPNPFARRREQRPIRRAARRAALIVTDSRWSRDEIKRELRPRRAPIGVIPLAPDSFWSPSVDAAPAELAGKRFVLLVGAREPRKNAAMLVTACGQAFDRDDELLVIVGDPAPDAARLLQRTGVGHRVMHPDDVTLRALYRSAALVAVPSHGEGFGLAAAEAMACGAPVVAARAAALPEVVGDAALLLDPDDTGAWADAIRSLLDDSGRARQLASAGAVRYAFAARNATARRTLALLRRIGEARGTPPELRDELA